jgi:hypothetical protein
MPHPRRDIPEQDARRLRALTRRIRSVESLWDERGALICRLRDEGYSFAAIAAATDANEEGVRKTFARYRHRGAQQAQPA